MRRAMGARMSYPEQRETDLAIKCDELKRENERLRSERDYAMARAAKAEAKLAEMTAEAAHHAITSSERGVYAILLADLLREVRPAIVNEMTHWGNALPDEQDRQFLARLDAALAKDRRPAVNSAHGDKA